MVRFSDSFFFCLFPDHTRKKVVFCLSKVTSVYGGELKVQCAVVLQNVSCVATDETLLQGLFFVGPRSLDISGELKVQCARCKPCKHACRRSRSTARKLCCDS